MSVSVTRIAGLIGIAGLGLGFIAAPLRAQEAAPKTQLRIAVEKGKELFFRQTLSVHSKAAPLNVTSTFDLVQEFGLTGEPTDEGAGGTRLATECKRVRIACETFMGKGKWDSKDGAIGAEDMEREGFEYNDLYASMMGVLAGKKPGVLLNRVGAVAALSDMGPVHAAAREAEPSASFNISLLEGVAWTPAHLFVQIPEHPVAKGDTFEFPLEWTTARPGVHLRHLATATLDAVGDGKATFSWAGTPTAWKRDARGKVTAAKEGTLTDGKCSGSATVSLADGLPLAVAWRLSGVFHTTALDLAVSDTFELTMKVERVEKLDPK